MDLQLPLINFDATKSKLIKINVTQLPPNEQLISPAPSREFIQDIMVRGQLVPIHLSKVGKDQYFVIAGRRRIKAFRELQKIQPDQWQVMDALVVDAKDEAAILAASAENNRRSGNVLTDLQALDYLLAKDPSMSIANLAKYSGMSQGTVKSRLKLKKLQAELLQALIDGKMTSMTAEKAASLPQEFQSKLVVQLIKDGKLALEDVSEAQRTNVQQTVDNLLPMFDTMLDAITPDKPKVDDYTVGVNSILGYAVLNVPDMRFMTLVNPRDIAQSELESYQGQVEDPTQFVLVMVSRS